MENTQVFRFGTTVARFASKGSVHISFNNDLNNRIENSKSELVIKTSLPIDDLLSIKSNSSDNSLSEQYTYDPRSIISSPGKRKVDHRISFPTKPEMDNSTATIIEMNRRLALSLCESGDHIESTTCRTPRQKRGNTSRKYNKWFDPLSKKKSKNRDSAEASTVSSFIDTTLQAPFRAVHQKNMKLNESPRNLSEKIADLIKEEQSAMTIAELECRIFALHERLQTASQRTKNSETAFVKKMSEYPKQMQLLKTRINDLTSALAALEDTILAKNSEIASNESLFITRMKEMQLKWIHDSWEMKLKQGCVFLKHGKSGYPHHRFVFCDASLEHVFWCHMKSTIVTYEKREIRTIVDIVNGHKTDAFKRTGNPETVFSCFSLVWIDYSLNIELVSFPKDQIAGDRINEAHRADWIAAFKWAIEKNMVSKRI